jgi:serine/threonine protein kinase
MNDNTCTGDDEGLSTLIASFSQSVAEETVTDPTERSEMSSYLSKNIADLIKRWQLPSVTFSSKDISSESWWPVDMTTIKLRVYRDTFEKDFQSTELCSRGAFGVIYRATLVTDNQVYAIKKININQLSPIDFGKKLREVVFMSRVDSTNVANYKHSWVEKNAVTLEYSLYLQMKYYQFTLDTFLEKIFHDIDELEQITYLHRGFLKHAIVALVFEELVSGVAYLQTPSFGKPSIVHGDLKPRNIFIDLSGADIVRIGDFGMANIEPPDPDETGLVDLGFSNDIARQDPIYGGTGVYMSPQQRSGKISSKNDVYSLGIILFEMSLMAETKLSNRELISAIECLKQSSTNCFTHFLDGPEHTFVRRLISMMISENCDYRPHVYHVQSLAAYRVCFATNKINFRYQDMTEALRLLQGDWKEFVKFYTPVRQQKGEYNAM